MASKKNDPPKKSASIKPVKRVMLPEVVVTATRLRKPSSETVKLYPKGLVSKKSVDSLKRVGYGKAIGEPVAKKGEKPVYGPASSDVIKKALNKK